MTHPETLPASYRDKPEPRPRVDCDYIAGMTDNYILDQYCKLIADSKLKMSG
jgi:dGTP triphosphohydrolase